MRTLLTTASEWLSMVPQVSTLPHIHVYIYMFFILSQSLPVSGKLLCIAYLYRICSQPTELPWWLSSQSASHVSGRLRFKSCSNAVQLFSLKLADSLVPLLCLALNHYMYITRTLHRVLWIHISTKTPHFIGDVCCVVLCVFLCQVSVCQQCIVCFLTSPTADTGFIEEDGRQH